MKSNERTTITKYHDNLRDISRLRNPMVVPLRHNSLRENTYPDDTALARRLM